MKRPGILGWIGVSLAVLGSACGKDARRTNGTVNSHFVPGGDVDRQPDN